MSVNETTMAEPGAACTGPYECILEPVVKTFIAQAHIILPMLAMYLLDAPFFLRYWGAARNIPMPESPQNRSKDTDASKSSKILDFICALAVFAVMAGITIAILGAFAVASYLFNREATKEEMIIHILGRGTFFVSAWPFFTNFSARAFGLRKPAVRRYPDGYISIVYHSTEGREALEKKLEMAGYILSNVFFFCALNWSNHAGLGLLFMITMHELSLNLTSALNSIRKMMLVFFILIAIVATLGIFFFWGSNTEVDEVLTDWVGQIFPDPDNNTTFQAIGAGASKFDAWSTFIILSAILQMFALVCYRFDNNNYILTDPHVDENRKAWFKDTCPTAERCSRSTWISKNLSTKFPKPYFTTAVLAWCASNFVALLLVAFKVVKMNYLAEQDGYDFGCLASVLAMPLSFFAVLGLAYKRGELKLMWKYEENWKGAPVTPEALGENEYLIEGEKLEKDGRDILVDVA